MHPLPELALPLPVLAFNLEDFLRSAFQILVLVFFFGAPLLRRAAKEQNPPRRQRPGPRRRSEAEERGEDLWRQLLEGLEEKAAQRPAAPPPPLPQARPVPSAATPGGGSGAAEPHSPRPLDSELAPGDLTGIDFSEIDEEALERAPESAHPVTAEGPPNRSAVGAGASTGLEAVSASAAAAEAQRELARSDAPHLLLPRDPAEWRRALILAEVLAPPVALRGQRDPVLPGRPLAP